MLETLKEHVGKQIRVADENNVRGCGICGELTIRDDKYYVRHLHPKYDFANDCKTNEYEDISFDDSKICYITPFREDDGCQSIRVQLGNLSPFSW